MNLVLIYSFSTQADLMEVQNLEYANKGIRYLLSVIDIYARFLQVVPLEDKEQQTVLDSFNKRIRSLDQKPLYRCTDLGKDLHKFP